MKRASTTAIGAFVVGAVVLGVVAVGVLGSGRFFRHVYPAVLFFSGDVNGLKVGAPVKFKGIPVGSVKSVLLSLGEVIGTRDPSQPFHVPVIIELDGDSIVQRGMTGSLDRATIEDIVGRGLRGSLKMESFVTGVLYVDLGMFPDTAAELQGGAELPYPEIPTRPTALEELQTKAQAFLTKLNEVDINRLADSLNDWLKHGDELVSSPDLKKRLADLPPTLQQIGGAAGQLHVTFGKIGGFSGNADGALVASRDTMRAAGAVFSADSPLLYRVDRALDDLSLAAVAIRRFAEELERNPDILLRGRAQPKEAKK
jgi:paraquat-inducible protein B